MFRATKWVVLLGAAIGLSAGMASAASWKFDESGLVAREASEGLRGGDNERPGDKRNRGGKLFGATEQIARESSEAARGEGKGHKRSDEASVIAREAGEARGEGKGHKRCDAPAVTA